MNRLLSILTRLIGRQRREAPAKLAATPLPDWRRIIATNESLWQRARRRAETGPRILVATAIGGHPQFTVVESLIAMALTLRGANVHVLLCDQALPACLRAKVSAISPETLQREGLARTFCGHCFATGRAVFDGTGLGIVGIGEQLDGTEVAAAAQTAARLSLAQVKDFRSDDLPVGEHGLAGALRYYGRGDISDEPQGTEVARRYVEAALLTAHATRRLVRQHRYDCAVVNHGIYVPHGILAAACRDLGVRVATWNLAYRKQCVIFSHDDTYHHTLMDEPTSAWEDMVWSPDHERAILRYLESRSRGARDWIWFNNKPDDDIDRFAASVGLDWNKPVIGMLTNVVWDAQLHYPANAFPSMVDWVIQTVAHFRDRPELQLLIRVHPGEVAPPGGQTKSNQPVAEIIREAFPNLPRNVFVIGPESPISTYACAARCNALIIYGTKAGVEFTSRGIPVIVAGEAWIRNKGLTHDATSPEHYRRILDALPLSERMDAATIGRARRYAYHFFFRRMIPLPMLSPVERAWPPFMLDVDNLDALLPGRCAGLDIVCDGILGGTPFVYPAEHLGVHDQ